MEHNLPEPTVAKQFSEKDLNSDLILTMTDMHKQQLVSHYGDNGRIYQLSEYVGEIGDIVDPFGGSIDTYRQRLNNFCIYDRYVQIHKPNIIQLVYVKL